MNTLLRTATPADAAAIRQLHLSAFDEAESQDVARLAVDLLEEQGDGGTLSLVAETDGVLSGHVAFSEVKIASTPPAAGYILGPLGVMPGFQRAGIGSKLVREGLRQLSEQGVELVFVYGDPDYYARFGFSVEAAREIEAPYPMQYPHGWQVLSLNKSASAPRPGRLSCVAALSDPALW